MASWFTEITNRAKSLAENVNAITESVINQVNTAQEEIASEQNRLKEEVARKNNQLYNDSLLLPWETTDESKAILSQSLMEEILSLSLADLNFMEVPPDNILSSIQFDFEQFIAIAVRLLKLDSNLARMHAKLSPRMKEEVFWELYYFRIVFLRVKIGMESNEVIEKYLSRESEIIHKNVIPISKSTSKDTIQTKNNNDINNNKRLTDNDNDDDEDDEALANIINQRRIADAELKAEVEAELDNDIDIDMLENELDNIDDIDDEFEDLGLDNIADGADDDDLEKQIARELNQDD